MPRQNRVLPTGEIVAHPARGMMMGNRGGCLHDAEGQLGRARWRSRAWICCLLSFKDRRRPIMAPGRYTELFFLDEAVALAAGHRPCAECRRAAFTAYRDAAQTGARAPELDARLHAGRLGPRDSARPADLPDGTFVLAGTTPHLVHGGALHPYAPEGYGPALPLPEHPLPVLTPALSRRALGAGYRPVLAPLAAARRAD
jgi:hypothetical protein